MFRRAVGIMDIVLVFANDQDEVISSPFVLVVETDECNIQFTHRPLNFF